MKQTLLFGAGSMINKIYKKTMRLNISFRYWKFYYV